MSNNALSIFDSGAVPAHARSMNSAVAKALQSTLAGGVARISIKGGVWRYIKSGMEIAKSKDRHLDVVLVNIAPHIGRAYYAGTFKEDSEPTAPDCQSVDGVTPDPKSANKQCDNCMSCPKNVKGSGEGDTRACRYSMRIAVVIANDIGGEVFQLSVPARSLFGKDQGECGYSLQGYYQAVTARGYDPAAAVVRMEFDTDVATPKIGFRPIRWLNAEEWAIAERQGQTEAAIKAITMTVFEVDTEKKEKPAQAAKQSAPVQSAAPKAKAEPKVEVEKAPTVREPAVAPPPDKNAAVAALISEWVADDE